MQLPADQPIPTRCPTFSPLAACPTSTTRPTASCPSTAGNCENPQSLLSIEMSEWHRPQCSTCTSTSSSASGPSSTCFRTNLLLAVGTTHASMVVIAILQQGEKEGEWSGPPGVIQTHVYTCITCAECESYTRKQSRCVSQSG